MENENNQCSRCSHFNRYYTKGIRHYLSAEAGYCGKRKCDVKPKECCEYFLCIPAYKKPSKGLLERINNLITQIAELSSMIEKEMEENDVDNE